MKNSKIPGLNAPFNLKSTVDKIEMMMMPGNVKKAGYNVEKKMTNINKEMDIDEKVFKNIDMDTEMIGWNRLNKQKGLSLFGDVDKDKTLNVFDCDPFDMTKQANIHELLKSGGEKAKTFYSKAKEKAGKFITITQIPAEPVEPRITIIPEEQEPKMTWKEKFARAREGTEKLGYAIGLLKTPEQRLEIEKRRVELAKARAAERIALAKAMPPSVPVRREAVYRAGRMVRRVMPPPIREISPAQKMSGIVGLTPYVGPMLPSYGMGGVGFREMVTGEKVVIPPPIPGVPGVPVQPVSAPRVISPYSKRPVAYTRGPYRKRTIVVQPDVPQYAPQY